MRRRAVAGRGGPARARACCRWWRRWPVAACAGSRSPGRPRSRRALVDGVEVLPVDTLTDVVELVRSARSRASPAASPEGGARRRPGRGARPIALTPPGPSAGGIRIPDLADVRGQSEGRRALEIALAGGHGLLLIGPPGSGKTMLASTVPGLLPPLDDEAALSVTIVASAAGEGPMTGLVRRPPFRSPHHTTSYAAMVGGGPRLSPGEITRADHGVLFLDELPEFDRDVLESLRQPLEEGRVAIARAGRAATFPARFQLIAAMNPCPCGFYGLRPRLSVPDRRRRALPAEGLGAAPGPDRPVGRDAARAAGGRRGSRGIRVIGRRRRPDRGGAGHRSAARGAGRRDARERPPHGPRPARGLRAEPVRRAPCRATWRSSRRPAVAGPSGCSGWRGPSPTWPATAVVAEAHLDEAAWFRAPAARRAATRAR